MSYAQQLQDRGRQTPLSELEIVVRLVAKIRHFFTFISKVCEAVHSLFNYKYQTDEQDKKWLTRRNTSMWSRHLYKEAQQVLIHSNNSSLGTFSSLQAFLKKARA
jgi:hypothetical protein